MIWALEADLTVARTRESNGVEESVSSSDFDNNPWRTAVAILPSIAYLY